MRLLLISLYQKFINFVFIQLFVSIIALPILLYWGLPISSMTVIGNFLFAPFLSLFLLLATLLFFTELCNLPNTVIVTALEYMCSLWTYCIQCGSSAWLIRFAQPPLLIALAIPLTALLILHLWLSRTYQVSALLLFTFMLCLYLTFICPPASYTTQIPCNKGEVLLLHHNKKTVLIDPGYITQNNASSWIEHTLLRELTKQLGSNRIDHLILLQPSSRLFEATTKLCKLAEVKNIYMPLWEGSLKKHQWRNFFELKQMTQAMGITLHRITKPITLSIHHDAELSLIPQTKIIRAGTIRYPIIHVRGHIGAKKITTASIKGFTKTT